MLSPPPLLSCLLSSGEMFQQRDGLESHECLYLIVTPFLFITTKSWDYVSKRLLAEPEVGLSKVEGGFWKKEPSGRSSDLQGFGGVTEPPHSLEKNAMAMMPWEQMPEGPSVRKFQLLTSPFVGQVVAKVGGSSRKLNVNDLNALRLQDSQVHGKNLYLAFVAAEGPFEPTADETALQREAACGAAQRQQGQVGAPHPNSQDKELQEPQHSGSEAPEGRGIWLHIHFGMFGSVRANEFSRANRANKRGDWKDPVPRLVLHFESGGFLVFYNCRMLWCSSPRADPASDILSVEFHRGRALRALSAPNPICYTLLDQRYFSGLGNIIKNEILYLARIHPLTPGSLLAPSDLEHLLDFAVQFSSEWLQNKLRGQGLHPQVYQKEQCPLGHPLMKGTFGPLGGFKRVTWWCPQCQPAVLPGGGDPSPGTESDLSCRVISDPCSLLS
uniref:Endonuclease 8-like 2 n=1 Tax=Garrulax canorus TaxID=238855 RepID=A0A3G1B4U7_9PASS|nr:nei endonuclease VIII-like 2 protein [Garrulax canorus]